MHTSAFAQAQSENKRDLYLLGQAYQASGRFQEAALQYETLAQKFPRELAALDEKDRRERIDIPWALQQAALLRRGLGEIDKWLQDVDLFIKNYGGHKEYSKQAAGLFFDLGEHYEERRDDGRIKKHYTEYLKTWADKGGIDRRIIAEVKLGELAWRSSCPVLGTSGACIEVERERPRPQPVLRMDIARENVPYSFVSSCRRPWRLGPCGSKTKALITSYTRDPALVNEAMAHFQAALKLHGNAALTSDTVTSHLARARMVQGDLLYEELMWMQPPFALAFDPRITSKAQQAADGIERRFLTWMNLKQRKLEEAKARYEQVMLLKNSYYTIAAAARISQLYLAFAHGLMLAAIPEAPPPPPRYGRGGCTRKQWIQDSRDAFCDHMTDAAEPLELQAKEHLIQCLRKAAELGESSEWSRLCEDELYRIDPSAHPLPSEIFSEPGNASGILDVAPLQPTGTEK